MAGTEAGRYKSWGVPGRDGNRETAASVPDARARQRLARTHYRDVPFPNRLEIFAPRWNQIETAGV